MKVRSVIAAFALVGATSAAPSIQNIEERQAPTCGVVGNDKGWLRAPSYNNDAASDDYDSAGNNNDAADHHNNATDHDNATAEHDNAAADYHNLLRQANEQHDLAGVNDIQPSSK
ncbi:unnamed protein product [Zymoseptoria tritici ST99CH_3D7]|uniref:Uncharacterized protein n=1 Tax=Zymoseptoria tritici (strain ST99CH_3D7) TaxID=1276538 RepID=A0A1X7RLV3_ZYMT9|nr:unnamed protein product [Zymoseptoria tritici ST99CH_3D7]